MLTSSPYDKDAMITNAVAITMPTMRFVKLPAVRQINVILKNTDEARGVPIVIAIRRVNFNFLDKPISIIILPPRLKQFDPSLNHKFPQHHPDINGRYFLFLQTFLQVYLFPLLL